MSDTPITQEMIRVVAVNEVSKIFAKETAVSKLSFAVPQGKIIGLIGPSGCGKTTTVRLMTGIYKPTEGKIDVFGDDPRRFKAVQREKIGYMTQLFTLFPDLTVKENMNFAAAIYGIGPIRRRKRIKELLDFVELTDSRRKLTRKLSGGMQRRLALAASLVHDPELIFLDEPTAGIDPILRRKFWDHFVGLKKQGKTLIVTTQYVNEAAYCDYVGVMNDGQLIMLEPPERLRQIAFGGEILHLETAGSLKAEDLEALEQLPFVRAKLKVRGFRQYEITVDDASTALPALMSWLDDHEIGVQSLEPFLPPYDDVFVKVVQDHRAKTAEANNGDAA